MVNLTKKPDLTEIPDSNGVQSASSEPGCTSDIAIMDLLRKNDALTVTQLSNLTGVTATAVRQRLNRLMGQHFIERQTVSSGRGRPSHRYCLTEKGRRQTGANFADLSVALWQEIRAIKDHEIRQGLIARLAKRMAAMYSDQITGETLGEKLESLCAVMSEKEIPFSVDHSQELPILKVEACPYPELADQDRAICAMEKMLFTELIGESLKLTQCRLEGASCCSFESN